MAYRLASFPEERWKGPFKKGKKEKENEEDTFGLLLLNIYCGKITTRKTENLGYVILQLRVID